VIFGPLAFTENIIARARWATDNNYGGLPDPDWPVMERRAVAIVLGDVAYLMGLDGSLAEAKQRLSGDLLSCDVETWIGAVRAELSR
jgi:hypothetical protein